jgi:hypothetical protein
MNKKTKEKIKTYLKWTIAIFIIFLMVASPLFVFFYK